MTVWYTADLHFDHPKIAEIRGYDNTDDHDNAIAAYWQNAVQPDDTVWILGDLSVATTTRRVERVLERVAGLPGTKHLITGNHDPCSPMYRTSHRWQRRYLDVFESVQAYARRRIAGCSVLLSHFPYDGDHTTEDRCTQYRLRDEGLWLLHGHTHADHVIQPGRAQIHVGWDAEQRFIDEARIAALIEKQEAE